MYTIANLRTTATRHLQRWHTVSITNSSTTKDPAAVSITTKPARPPALPVRTIPLFKEDLRKQYIEDPSLLHTGWEKRVYELYSELSPEEKQKYVDQAKVLTVKRKQEWDEYNNKLKAYHQSCPACNFDFASLNLPTPAPAPPRRPKLSQPQYTYQALLRTYEETYTPVQRALYKLKVCIAEVCNSFDQLVECPPYNKNGIRFPYSRKPSRPNSAASYKVRMLTLNEPGYQMFFEGYMASITPPFDLVKVKQNALSVWKSMDQVEKDFYRS